jgi:hypothetical protein
MENKAPKVEAQDWGQANQVNCAGRSCLQPPRLKAKTEGGTLSLEFHSEEEAEAVTNRLMECLGTDNRDFADQIVLQLSRLSDRSGELDENTLNYLIAVVSGIEPRDQVEAMLAAQMAAVHTATMTFANRLKQVVTVEQQDSAEKAFNKLTRTFTSQMEALRKYRHGGEQKVTVQHVNVNEGGQAVVGNVSQTKSANQKNI